MISVIKHLLHGICEGRGEGMGSFSCFLEITV